MNRKQAGKGKTESFSRISVFQRKEGQAMKIIDLYDNKKRYIVIQETEQGKKIICNVPEEKRALNIANHYKNSTVIEKRI